MKNSILAAAGGDIERRKAEHAAKRHKNEADSAARALAHVTEELDAARRARRPAKIPRTPKTTKRTGDTVRVLFGDLHGCRMKLDAVAALLADIRSLKPDEIIIGGDMLECGGFLAAHHVLGYIHEVEESYAEDIEAGNHFLDELQKAAPQARIEYIEGNHEARVEKWILTQRLRSHKDIHLMRRAFGADFVLNLKERGIPYFRRSETYDNLRVPGWIKRGKIYVTHELASGKHAGSKAVGEAGANVVFFHTHTRSEGIMDTPGHGLAMAWNPGCLCRRQPLWRHTRPTGWNHGYAVQFVSRTTGNFLMQNILIDEGMSMLTPFLNRKPR